MLSFWIILYKLILSFLDKIDFSALNLKFDLIEFSIGLLFIKEFSLLIFFLLISLSCNKVLLIGLLFNSGFIFSYLLFLAFITIFLISLFSSLIDDEVDELLGNWDIFLGILSLLIFFFLYFQNLYLFLF